MNIADAGSTDTLSVPPEETARQETDGKRINTEDAEIGTQRSRRQRARRQPSRGQRSRRCGVYL